MRTCNTMEKKKFVVEHFVWAAILFIWYKNILFRCIRNLSLEKSMFVLGMLLVLFSTAGICLRMKRGRNGAGIILNLLLPYGIYTVMAYHQIARRRIVFCLGLAAVISGIYALLVLGRKIKNRRRYGRIVCCRIKRAALASQSVFACGLAVLMLSFAVHALFGSTIMTSAVGTSYAEPIEEQTINNNMDTILKLRESVWKSLEIQEKLDILQTVANIERRYLGISNELRVGTANLEKGNLGYYNDDTYEIVVSIDTLLDNSSKRSLETVCHEAYHSYQHRMVEVYINADEGSRNLQMFRDAGVYAEEFGDYADGSEDFDTYYEQACESDARAYAEQAVCDYYMRLDSRRSE